jgi:murein DD-endopeptidase MepM/ murein hydrolase activator NlpD
VCGRQAGLTRGGGPPAGTTGRKNTAGSARVKKADAPPKAHPVTDAAKAKPKPKAEPKRESKPESKKPGSGSGSYEVVRGDTLSGIADEHAVRGGWQHLYAENRQVVGPDPDLILPGQELTLPHQGGKRPAAAKPASERKTTPQATKSAVTDAPAYVAPVSGHRLGTPWGAAGSLWASGHHTGQDFVVPTGTSVKAVASGTVVSAGWGGAYGYQVVLRHPDGMYTQYAHLSSLTVRAGQPVRTGQQLGRSGSTGNTTGPHLHFEVRTGPNYGSDVSPLAYLRRHGVHL